MHRLPNRWPEVVRLNDQFRVRVRETYRGSVRQGTVNWSVCGALCGYVRVTASMKTKAAPGLAAANTAWSSERCGAAVSQSFVSVARCSIGVALQEEEEAAAAHRKRCSLTWRWPNFAAWSAT